MKKVLFIAYYYPPLGGIGSQRSQKFARYLLEYDWHPIVLTPEKGSYLLDPSLEDGSGRGIEVLRTKAIDLSSMLKRATGNGGARNGNGRVNGVNAEPGRIKSFIRHAVRTWAYIPDAQIGWYPFAARVGRQVLNAQNVDAIFSTSFPVTSHLVAYKLKAATGKPWIADFRDLWTEFHYADYSSSLRRRLDRLIESRLLEKADAIVTVSDTLADTLRRLTRRQKRVEVIRNGFDSEDFNGIEYVAPTKWTITYVGLFYGTKQDPTPFLEALRRAINSDKIIRSDVQFNIVGEPDPYVQELIVRFGLSDITHFTGFVPHHEALAYQIRSSLLLLILHGDKANPGVITGKIFEYLGSRRPIFGIVPSHFEAAQIIRETGAGVTVDPTDVEGIEQHLVVSYSRFKSGAGDPVNEFDLSAYERRRGCKQLADLLTELTDHRHTAGNS